MYHDAARARWVSSRRGAPAVVDPGGRGLLTPPGCGIEQRGRARRVYNRGRHTASRGRPKSRAARGASLGPRGVVSEPELEDKKMDERERVEETGGGAAAGGGDYGAGVSSPDAAGGESGAGDAADDAGGAGEGAGDVGGGDPADFDPTNVGGGGEVF